MKPELRVSRWFEQLEAGDFDTLEEALESLEELREQIPSSNRVLLDQIDQEAMVLGEQLRCIYMDEPVPTREQILNDDY